MYVEDAYAKIAAENFKIHRHYFFYRAALCHLKLWTRYLVDIFGYRLAQLMTGIINNGD